MKADNKMNRSMAERDAEVMKTLKILDDMPRIEVHHLFRARLLQRIETGESRRAIAGGFNPRLAFFSLLLAINIGMGMLMITHRDPQSVTAHGGATAESYSDDYGGPALSYYEQAADSQGNE